MLSRRSTYTVYYKSEPLSPLQRGGDVDAGVSGFPVQQFHLGLVQRPLQRVAVVLRLGERPGPRDGYRSLGYTPIHYPKQKLVIHFEGKFLTTDKTYMYVHTVHLFQIILCYIVDEPVQRNLGHGHVQIQRIGLFNSDILHGD